MTQAETAARMLAVFNKSLEDLRERLAKATPDELATFGPYVIGLSEGIYYVAGATQAHGILRATRYMHENGAAHEAKRVRDGMGNQGRVMDYREALKQAIANTEQCIVQVKEMQP